MTPSSASTWPASAQKVATMQRSPSWTSWATWAEAMIRQRLASRVTPPPPTVPVWIEANSRTRLPSPISRRVSSPRYLRSCGGEPTTAWAKMRLPVPIVVWPSTTAWAPTTLPGPMRTLGPITAKGPISQLGSISAPGATTAVGWMATISLPSSDRPAWP